MAGASKRRRSYAGRVTKRMRMFSASTVSKTGVAEARFKRTAWVANWAFTTASTAGYYRTVSPAFSALSNVAEYTQLFDVYKVHKVTVTIIPRYGDTSNIVADTGVLTAYNNQFFMTVGTDKNSQLTPSGTYSSATYNEFLSSVDNARVYKLDRPFSYSFRPKIANSISTGSSFEYCPWINTLDTNQLLLGSRCFIHDVNFTALATVPISVDILYTLDFSCRGQR